MIPASSSAGRAAIARASAAACAGVRIGERLGPTLIRPPRDVEAGVELDAHADRRGGSRRGARDQVQVVDRVDHHDRAAVALELPQFAECGPVGRRIGEQEVVVALPGQPQRLREGEGHQAAEAGTPEDPLQQRAAAHRLAGHPDGLAARAGQHLVRVLPHGVQVHEGERGIERGEDALKLRVAAGAAGHRPRCCGVRGGHGPDHPTPVAWRR